MLFVIFVFLLFSVRTEYIQPGLETTQLQVSGNCNMCKKRIEIAVLRQNGVKAATWDKHQKQLVVIHKPKVSVATIQQAVLEAGHDVESEKAELLVYQKLPPCCLYRNPTAQTH